MIRVLDEKTEKFVTYLNNKRNYGITDDCMVSVFHFTDVIPVDEEGNTEQSFFIDELNLIALTTGDPLEGIKDAEGNEAPEFYQENYTILKLAHEYAHFLQKYGILDNPKDEEQMERIADKWAQETVTKFLEEYK